jgi:MoaA/NifB/PqqE/SkfB family radical SAM enzyme
MITTDWKDFLDKGLSDANIPAANRDRFEVQIILDILEGCKYNCPGCYVDRRNNYDTKSMDDVLILMDQVEAAGMYLDDVTIGPTDFFGADNILDVLRDERMKKILSRVDGIQHNTSIDESVSDDNVYAVIEVLESFDEYLDLNYDVQIAIDLNKVMTDEGYRDLIDKRWNIFKESKLKYEVSLLANIDDTAMDVIGVTEYVKNRWKTVIEYVPSVMRSNGSRMKDTIEKWREYRTGYNLHSDISHKTFHHLIVGFNNGKSYLSPFIYENAAIYNDDYLVEPTVDSILAKTKEITNWQYENAGPTCMSCSMLNQCISHLIPYFTIKTLGEDDYCPINREEICQ